MKNRFIITNLLTFTNYLHDSFCNSAQTDVVYIDYNKALDVIDHSLCMNKIPPGVSQGSNLGPILFAIINIYDWSLSSGFKLNLQKYWVMSYEKSDRIIPFAYCIDQTNLTRVCFIEDLGVTFDSRLRFDKHIKSYLKHQGCLVLLSEMPKSLRK